MTRMNPGNVLRVPQKMKRSRRAHKPHEMHPKLTWFMVLNSNYRITTPSKKKSIVVVT